MDKTLDKIFKPKKPSRIKSEDSYVGIEIEFISNKVVKLKSINFAKQSNGTFLSKVNYDEI